MKTKNRNTPATIRPQVEDASAENIEGANSDFAQTQSKKEKKRELHKKDWAILKRFISYSLQYKKTLISLFYPSHSYFFFCSCAFDFVQISDKFLHKYFLQCILYLRSVISGGFIYIF